MQNLSDQLETYHSKLSNHPVYRKINTPKNLEVFMETHIFAVWDFMSLLKSLQREITCVELPWSPSKYSKSLVRMINEIVLGEESDLDLDGQACDHFTLYLDAMRELGADTTVIENFLSNLKLDTLAPHIKKFVSFNLELALGDSPHKTAAAFFYGREKLIPDMFTGIRSHLNNCPKLLYYIDRHIELDGDEHSELAQKCLIELCEGDSVKMNEALEVGLKSLQLRNELWDGVLEQIESLEYQKRV
ncbi:DUF3050 domain-containing protein [Halobacteriovorax sp. HLS]|uniref:DUF3050 domain-containing protein n=1 Tax=Halobacteriovorax sp. HLS TaxID=2234000 RepID=UPI000FDA1C9D|nr:DUF3050 domain-containing protein [Halobacteriovorax sp. HLS]